MKIERFAAKVIGLTFFCSSMMLAQSAGTGGISGVVIDSSGAVIPGVKVTVTNSDTGIGSTLMTDATGGYHVPSLSPGLYEVRGQQDGFETTIRKGLKLTVGSSLEINLTLTVGQVAQQAVVTGEAPIVNTLSSTVSGLVDDKTIRDLPLNGRSFDQLVSLESSAPTFRSRGRATAYGMADLYTVNGAGTQSNVYLIDGTELQGAGSGSQLPGGVLGKNMGVDAIQEFSVLTSNYSASYGKKAGGIINIATRSGTNQFHGSAFEFLRNSVLDARNFFDGATLPSFKRNEFGGAIGGPIKKDNSFFFVNYEGLREGVGLTKVATVPDANAQQGLLPCKSAPTATCNPATGLANVGLAAAVVPYLAAGIFPLPNGRLLGDGTGLFTSNPQQINKQDFVLMRIDQKISDKDTFFGRYNYDQGSQASPDTNAASNQFSSPSDNRDQDLTLEEKRGISPTTVNVVRFGLGRAYTHSTTSPYTALPTSLNFLPGADTVGSLSFSANGNVVAQQGLNRGGASTAGGHTVYAVTQYDFQEQLFRYVGPHSLQFGVQFQRNQANDMSGDATLRGNYLFSSLSNFLQGISSTFTGALPSGFDPHKSYRRSYFSAYAQDDYKIRRNLTLNLGVRYELLTVPVDATNRLSNFGYTYIGGFRVLNATPTLNGSLYQGNHLNFAPRIGFAWDPWSDGKTSVRGGYGLFFDQELQSNHFYLSKNAPFAGTFTITNPLFPNPLAGGSAVAPPPAPDSLDTAWQTPVRMQWSLGIQRQVGSSSVINIGFVGSHSYHLPRTWNANTFIPTFINGTVFFPAGLVQANRLQPALSGTSRFVSTDVNSSYNALQTSFTQRLSRGLRAQVSYTYSKALDYGPGAIASYVTGELGVTENPFNARGDYGPSAFNLKHNFVTNLTYDLPWHKTAGVSGKLLGGWQVGGIFTSHPGTPFTVTTGFSRSRSGDNTNPDRPNLSPGVSGVPILGGPDRYFDSSVFSLPTLGFYGNVGRNDIVGPGFTNLDMTTVKSTTINERLKVDFRAEFFNLLNHANFALPSSVIFDSTGQYLGSAGHISSTVTTSRQIQFGLKFIF